ncbi:hypothetical protein [Nostoc sp.]|uniref:hypothetical protein n=1 Tax=Nostoc sp. TaxID=1180 RepID=UPI002FFA1FD6
MNVFLPRCIGSRWNRLLSTTIAGRSYQTSRYREKFLLLKRGEVAMSTTGYASFTDPRLSSD